MVCPFSTPEHEPTCSLFNESTLLTGWYRNRDIFALYRLSFARTFVAGFADGLTSTVACSACRTQRKWTGLDGFHSCSIAGPAFLRLRTHRAARAFAAWIQIDDAHVHVFVTAANGFLKGQIER